MKKFLLLIATCLVSIEFFSFLTTVILSPRVLTSNPSDYTLSKVHIESLKPFYHQELGWDLQNKTTYNERVSSKNYGLNNVLTFGDSFTRGDDVPDNCTWQEYLEPLLNADVLNFGTGGYGVDQAFLKYQIKKSQFPKAKNVILTFIPGDVNRNMNVYRNLVKSFEGSWPELTKPYFIVNDSHNVELVKNPIADASELYKLENPDFINSLMKQDWWHKNHDFPAPRFPYLTSVFNKSYLKQLFTPLDYDPWFSSDGVMILEEILSQFSNLVKLSGGKPLILFVPDFYFMNGLLKDDKRIAKIENIFLNICQRRNLQCKSAVSIFSNREKLKVMFNTQDDSSHYSCQGNKILANFIAPLL
jgi:hypothetical protein